MEKINLENMSYDDLKKLNRELITTMRYKEPQPKGKIFSSRDAIKFLHELQNEDVEILKVLLISNKQDIIKKEIITIGTADGTFLNIAGILKLALVNNATGIIIAHNHPRGESVPSIYDKEETKVLNNTCKLVDITLIDHIVFSKDGYCSFKEQGLL